MENNTNLKALFTACDLDGSGYLDQSELSIVCKELSREDLDVIFEELDRDGDGKISVEEFQYGFSAMTTEGGSKARKSAEEMRGSFSKNRRKLDSIDCEPGTEFVAKLDEGFTALSCQEQVCELYQQLHTSEQAGLLGQFESIILGVIKDIRSQQQENKRLEQSFKREKEYNERHLQQLEQELDNQVRSVSSHVKEEEKEKYEREINELRSQYQREKEELENTLQKLQSLHVPKLDSCDRPNDEQLGNLKAKIDEVSQENRYLKSDLTDAQTTLALLRSELASARQELSDKCSELSCEKQTLIDCEKEHENLTRQLHLLHDANKKLHDTNDDLRAAVEASRHTRSRSRTSVHSAHSTPVHDTSHRLSPSQNSSLAEEISQTEQPPSHDYRRPNVLPSHESCEIDSLPEDFDSGHSTLRDINEIDSEEEQDSRSSRRLKRSGHSADSEDTEGELDRALQRSYDDFPKIKRRREKSNSRPNSAGSRSSVRSTRSVDSSGSVRRKLPTPPNMALTHIPIVTGDPERMYKVVLAGDAAVGKTSFIMRLCKGTFVTNISSTLGVDFHTKIVEVDGRLVALQLWDTAGQERFRSIAKSYFRRADGVLLLYDCTYERSFLNVREWIDAIEDGAQKKLPIMMCANKSDLRPQAEKLGQKVVSQEVGLKLAKDYSALFIETSAKDGSNIYSSVIELTRMLRTNEDLEVKSVGLQLHEMQVDGERKLPKCC